MARRFRFNLQAVLRLREVQEEQARKEYLEVNRLINEERLKRQSLQDQRSSLQDEIVQGLEKQEPFQTVVANYHQVGRLEGAVQESMRREQQLQVQLEQKRLVMVERRKDTRIMENLKERRLQEYLTEQDKAEQAFLDELGIQSQGRRIREARMEVELAEDKARTIAAMHMSSDENGESAPESDERHDRGGMI